MFNLSDWKMYRTEFSVEHTHTHTHTYVCKQMEEICTFRAPPGGATDKEPTYQCRKLGRGVFDPWVGKIPWRKEWHTPPVFLPGKFHGQRSPLGYNPWGHKESDMTEQQHTHTAHTHINYSVDPNKSKI